MKTSPEFWKPLGFVREASRGRTLGTEDWLGMVIMRIQRPSTLRVFTVLNDCDPPFTCAPHQQLTAQYYAEYYVHLQPI